MDNRPYVVRRKTSNKAEWARSSRTSSTSEGNAAPRSTTPSVTNVIDPSAGDKKLPFDDGSSDFATCPRPGEDSDESGPLDPQSLRPGAVAVRGVSSAPEDRSDDDFRPAGRRDGGGGGSDPLEYGSSMSAALGDGGRSPLALAEPVAAYKVQDDIDDDDDNQDESSPAVEDEAAKAAAEAEKMEQIRRQILASAAEAVVVTVAPDDNEEDKSWFSRNQIIVVLLAILTAIAVAVGVAVPLSNQQNIGGAPAPAPDVLASVTYNEPQGVGGFAGAISAETKQGVFFGNLTDTTTGSAGFISCAIKGCALNQSNCVNERIYVPGCCMGSNCPLNSKCGNVCPQPPDSCYLTNPQNTSCTQSKCYTCMQVNGQDVYELSDFIFTINCLRVGTAIRESNQQVYKWAIFCGPVAVSTSNQGENLCVAAREGAGYTDDSGGIFTYYLSCQRIALAECQCGPPDMDTYGLPAPNETCSLNGTCPYRCDDAGPEGVSTICEKFPGNITWWEGQNALNQSWFIVNFTAPNSNVDIYIKP